MQPSHRISTDPSAAFRLGFCLSILVFLLLASGCNPVGPNYALPEPRLLPEWSQTAPMYVSATPAPEDLATWWRQFNDPVLNDLIDKALVGSPDLHLAQARLRESRARRNLANAGLFPSVDLSGSGSRSKGSEETGGGTTNDFYTAGFDASWEIDVFGGLRRGVEAAQADLETSQANYHDTQVSLVSEVALNYVDLRSAQSRILIARENLASQTETLQITQWKAQAGLTDILDVEQARTNCEQTRAAIPSIEITQAEAEHRLAVLLGLPPGMLREQLNVQGAIPPVPAQVVTGIPADIIRRRPDIRAAERSLAAETARVGQQTADLYPKFTLSGSLGLESLMLGSLVGTSAIAHSVAGGFSTPFFDAGRIRDQIEIQNAVQEQALVTYESTILTALEDVENALVSLSKYLEREKTLASAVEAARNAADLARQNYEGGRVDFQTVLDTERNLFTVEESQALAQANCSSSLIQLYKALGGGWTPMVQIIATSGQ